jgi:molybdenum cofactor guanylyltransferase
MTAHEARVLAAVLAGGRASRMGTPKPTVALEGRPLIEHPLEALRDAGLEAIVVAKPGSMLPALGVPVWEEPEHPRHPLCGVLRALQGAGGRPVLAVACDMPFVTPPLLARMASIDGRLVVPEVSGRLHPLLARYPPELAGPLADALRRRAPLQDAVRELHPRVVDEGALRRFGSPERLLFNVNDRADLLEAERLLAR